jgi:hypothetical protein
MINLHDWSQRLCDFLFQHGIYIQSISVDFGLPNTMVVGVNHIVPVYNSTLITIDIEFSPGQDYNQVINVIEDDLFLEQFEFSKADIILDHDLNAIYPKRDIVKAKFYQHEPRWEWEEV